MIKNKKTPATVAAVGREAEQAARQKPYSKTNYNTDDDKRQEQFYIAGMLPRGSENAITTAELLRRSGFQSKRLLTKEIEAERRAGALILSKNDALGGYFLPSCRAEVENFVQSMTGRAKSIFVSIRAARKALREMDAPTEA